MSDQTAYIETMRFRKRQVIFREGEMGNCMFAVDEGRVGIVSDYGQPTEKPLTEIPVGGFFGEMGMVRGLPRSATAVALESDTVVSAITWETLGLYFKQSPAKIVGIMQQMAQRIEALSTDYIGACGAVDSLSRRCEALSDENRRLHKEIARLRPQEASVPEMPFWETVKGESEESQNARFHRYILEYQNYLRVMEHRKGV